MQIKAIKATINPGDYAIYISVWFTKYPMSIFVGILTNYLKVNINPPEKVSLTGYVASAANS